MENDEKVALDKVKNLNDKLAAAAADAKQWEEREAAKHQATLAHTDQSRAARAYFEQRLKIDATETEEIRAHRARIETLLEQQNAAAVRLAEAVEKLADRVDPRR